MLFSKYKQVKLLKRSEEGKKDSQTELSKTKQKATANTINTIVHSVGRSVQTSRGRKSKKLKTMYNFEIYANQGEMLSYSINRNKYINPSSFND